MKKKQPTVEEANILAQSLKRCNTDEEYRKQSSKCMETFDFLVKQKLRRYKSFDNYDDLLQEGRIVLLNALNTYEIKKGSFYYWANWYIETKIRRRASQHSSMKVPIKHAGGMKPIKVDLPFFKMVDNSPTPYESCRDEADRRTIQMAVEGLPSDQKHIISMFFEIGGTAKKTVEQICESLNISKSECIKSLNEAKRNLAIALSHENSTVEGLTI